MRPANFWFFIAASVPLQLALGTIHFYFASVRPEDALLREALPVAYLAVTYFQWLSVAFVISLRTGKYRVPLVMHLPHLLSFLPLVRHIMLAAEHRPLDTTSLNYAWIHSVVTHSFSLVAAWLWQVRREFDDGSLLKQRIIPIALYGLSALTVVLLYAGLDFSFSSSVYPVALGAIQLALYIAVTAFLLLRERIRALEAPVAAVAFVLVNTLLLFDRTRSDIGVELALAAGTATQLFTVYVFLVFSVHRKR